MDAASIVLMKRENGILTTELGSYIVNEGIDFIFKAYVEDEEVYLYLTVNTDVTDEQFSDIFEKYDLQAFNNEGYDIIEIDDEYNPVWCVKFKFADNNEEMKEKINNAIEIHLNNLRKINYL